LPVRLVVGDDGAVRTVPDRTGPVGMGPVSGLAELLLIAAAAATAGTWPRLKVCGADDCRWAFYDRSPTRSGCWCSMAGCGARAKSRAYRQRAAASRQAPWTS
jgi:predicted RNA-binding Zn ribbon-like protein